MMENKRNCHPARCDAVAGATAATAAAAAAATTVASQAGSRVFIHLIYRLLLTQRRIVLTSSSDAANPVNPL